MKFAIAALTMTLLSGTLSSTAAALTVIDTGNYSTGEYVFRSGSFGLSPGKYRATLTFSSAPSFFWQGYVEKQTVTNFFCEDPSTSGTFNCGGDGVPTLYDFIPVTPTRYVANITVNPFKTVPFVSDPIVRYDEFDSCCDYYNFEFDAGEAGSYALTLGAIPEPANWAMMIVGLGAVGAVMRRRARHVAIAA